MLVPPTSVDLTSSDTGADADAEGITGGAVASARTGTEQFTS